MGPVGDSTSYGFVLVNRSYWKPFSVMWGSNINCQRIWLKNESGGEGHVRIARGMWCGIKHETRIFNSEIVGIWVVRSESVEEL